MKLKFFPLSRGKVRFTNDDAANVLVNAGRTRLVQFLLGACAVSRNEHPVTFDIA